MKCTSESWFYQTTEITQWAEKLTQWAENLTQWAEILTQWAEKLIHYVMKPAQWNGNTM